MTLVDLERLVRRIEEAMDAPPANGALPRLAADYQNACRAAAQRLGQCAAMIAVGDEHQALQLAEAQPPLLDQLTLLAFRRSPDWRVRCRAENLPTAENFDIKPVRQVNELYAKGIDKDHALYREYRRAVMLNDDVRALAVLRSIARLNPNDKNAGTELDRLEHKFRADKVHKLEKAVREKHADAEIGQLADEIESLPEAQKSSAWIPAQTIRGAWLFEQAHAARRTGAADELRQHLQKLSALAHLLNNDQRAKLEEFEKWAAADLARRKEAASRRIAIDALSEVVSRLETENKQTLQELRAESDSLERSWRNIEQFHAEVPNELSARAQKLRDTLRLRIDRSLRASRRLAFLGVAAIVLVCIASAWTAYSRQAARSLAHRIQSSISERRVADTESALARATNQFALPALNNARSAAGEFLERERALKSTADRSIAALQAFANAKFTNSPPSQIATNFTAARNSIAALAPEFRAPAEASFGKLDSEWQDFLRRESETRGDNLSPLLDRIEGSALRSLQYDRDPEMVRRAANELRMELDEARSIAEPAVLELRPKQEIRFRFETLEANVNKFTRDATNWSAAHRQLAAATNLGAYNAALQLLVSSGFTPGPQRAAVAAFAASNLSGQNLLAPLLLPNAPVSALSNVTTSRVPDEILPAEREVQRRLREDENIHAISRLQIEVKSLPPEDPRRKRIVFLRGELQRRITRRSGQIYDPLENPAALQFDSKEMASLDYTVEEPVATPERELYDHAGLPRLIDSNSGKYQISLLQALDDINRDRASSPLFRAWLFLRLCEMIDAQPAQWSAIWSPAFASDRADLNRLGSGQIQSGDWFVPKIASQRAPSLNAHFDRAALHSYSRQASFFRRLLPKAAEAGVRLVGYIDANGQPVFREARALGPVWGLIAANEPARVIFNSVSPNESPQARAQPLPYSPLFIYAGNANQLIDATLQSLGYSASAVGLPESLPPILWPTQ